MRTERPLGGRLRLSTLRDVASRRLDFVADPLAQPGHRLRMASDECLPLGFTQRDGDDALAVTAHAVKDTYASGTM